MPRRFPTNLLFTNQARERRHQTELADATADHRLLDFLLDIANRQDPRTSPLIGHHWPLSHTNVNTHWHVWTTMPHFDPAQQHQLRAFSCGMHHVLLLSFLTIHEIYLPVQRTLLRLGDSRASAHSLYREYNAGMHQSRTTLNRSDLYAFSDYLEVRAVHNPA